MTECPDCAAAAKVLHHGFRANCRGCCARAAARSPQFFKVRQAGMQDRGYRALLDRFGLTHAEVKAAHAADVAGRVDA
jgi:hypothetical protein